VTLSDLAIVLRCTIDDLVQPGDTDGREIASRVESVIQQKRLLAEQLLERKRMSDRAQKAVCSEIVRKPSLGRQVFFKWMQIIGR
jgi:hypothetical protein